jgi:acetyl-CoA acetyltransferase
MVGVSSVQTAALAVQTALRDAVVYEGHTSLSDGSHGVSIDFSPATSFTPADYALMQFAIDTHWDEYLTIAP